MWVTLITATSKKLLLISKEKREYIVSTLILWNRYEYKIHCFGLKVWRKTERFVNIIFKIYPSEDQYQSKITTDSTRNIKWLTFYYCCMIPHLFSDLFDSCFIFADASLIGNYHNTITMIVKKFQFWRDFGKHYFPVVCIDWESFWTFCNNQGWIHIKGGWTCFNKKIWRQS